VRHEVFQAGRPHGLEGIVMAFKPCRAFNGRLANADYKISGGYRSAPDITLPESLLEHRRDGSRQPKLSSMHSSPRKATQP
jgi:hypothetical protein